jgi:anaerobic magnesium-protoporphyrin IX monomethyl ester cyclase
VLKQGKEMKILLVDPPRKFWSVFLFNTASCGLAHIAAYLESQEHGVAIADLYGLDSPWEALENIVRREEPQVIGVTCTVAASSYDAVHCAMLVKMINPDIKVVGGGFMFSAIPEDFLETGYFDYICIGEGEITFGELVDAIEKKTDISAVKGIAYLNQDCADGGDCFVASAHDGSEDPNYFSAAPNEEPVITQARPFIENLATLPMPAWHLFPMDRYSIKPMGGNVAFSLTNSRGCVNSCAFCSESLLWKSTYRSFPAAWTCDNLEVLTKKYGKTVYIFGDNDFLYDRERLIDFCIEMEKRRIKAYFWIEASVRSILKNKDLLPRLRNAGGFNIQMGLETVSPEVLEAYNKPQTLDEMKRAIRAVKDCGLSVTGLFIWGDWNDTLETLRNGINFINRHADFIAPSIINPFPGTAYYKRCKEEGRIKELNLWKYNQHHVTMPLKSMSMEEAAEAYEENAYSPAVLLNMIYQALFSPYRPARSWAWEFLMLDVAFINPRNRLAGGEMIENYLERTNRKMPPWTFPYPKESVAGTAKMGVK